MLFAGENVIPVVHEGNATGVQVAVMLGLVGFAADVNSALAERVDDNGGLSAGPSLKVAVPGILFCHLPSANLIITRSDLRPDGRESAGFSEACGLGHASYMERPA